MTNGGHNVLYEFLMNMSHDICKLILYKPDLLYRQAQTEEEQKL